MAEKPTGSEKTVRGRGRQRKQRNRYAPTIVKEEGDDWDAGLRAPAPGSLVPSIPRPKIQQSDDWDAVPAPVPLTPPATSPNIPIILNDPGSTKPYNGVLLQNHSPNIQTIYKEYCFKQRFEFFCIKLLGDETVRLALENGVDSIQDSAFWEANSLRTQDWSSSIMALLPDIGNHLNSSNMTLRTNAENLWNLAVSHGHYLGITNFIIDTNLNPQFNRVFLATLESKEFYVKDQFHVRFRLFSNEDGHPKTEGLWEKWIQLHTMISYNECVKISLDFTYYQPGSISDFELKRWLTEPVGLFMIDEESFVFSDGKCDLRDEIKNIFKHCIGFHASPTVTLSDRLEIDSRKHNLYKYKACIDLVKKEVATDKIYLRYKENDKLIISLFEPLQPLHHNLSKEHYNIFRSDDIKYTLYQRAIKRALGDIISKVAKSDEKILVVVAGAGKDGPLISCTTDSAKELGILDRLKIYAVEKNHLALHCLTRYRNPDWKNTVTFIRSDIRTWKFPEKVDIIISELLGSFGDNELCPECLCSAHKNLKGGIMIPRSYTSYLQPLSNPRLYTMNPYVKVTLPKEERQKTVEKGWLTLFDRTLALAQPQETFQFTHPLDEQDDGKINDRFKELNFTMEGRAVLHGFGGFFETELYDDIVISTHPERYTPTLESWDPMYFQLMDPILVNPGDKVTLLFWRKASNSSVWYQWALTSPQTTHIHNLNGKFYKLEKSC